MTSNFDKMRPKYRGIDKSKKIVKNGTIDEMKSSHKKALELILDSVRNDDKIFLRGEIAKYIDRGLLEYLRDDKIVPNGDINVFLKTKEGQDFLKKVGYDKDLGIYIDNPEDNPNKDINQSLGKKIKRTWNNNAAAVSFLIASQLFSNCSSPVSEEKIIVKPGDNLLKIAREYIHKDDSTSSNTYRLEEYIAKHIASTNDIKDRTKIYDGDTITINSDQIHDLVEKYKKDSAGSEIDPNIHKEEEINEKNNVAQASREPIVLTSENGFSKSTDYIVKKLYRDTSIKNKIVNLLRQGYKVHIPSEIENSKTKPLTVDEITKPITIIDNSLQGVHIVLDPGHGSMDTGAIGIAQYGEAANKEKIVVFEAPIMVDIVYRIGKLIRSHGGSITLTHYANRRGILDRDLPPVSRSFDKSGNEVYQDIRYGTDKTSPGQMFKSGGRYLSKRAVISNNQTKANAFISFHADVPGEPLSEGKILSIKSQPGKYKSKQFAQDLLDNGFGYYYGGKKSGDVNHDIKDQDIQVLRDNKHVAVLVEIANINETNQAYYLRAGQNRQKLAESFISALEKSL